MFKIKQRSYIDQNNEHDILQLMRAFGILMVVVQHSVVLYFNTGFSNTLITVCVFIDVHVFMFVSGYLFQKYSGRYLEMGFRRFTAKKFKSLMVPYLFWAGILFAATYILYLLSDLYGFHAAEASGFQRLSVTQIMVGLLTYRYFHMQLYWFLFALFWVFIINYAFLKFTQRPEWVLICFAVISLMSVDFAADEYILTKIGRSILTFGFGRIFRKYRLERGLIKNWQALIVFLAAFIAGFRYLYLIPAHISDPHLVSVLRNFQIASLGICGIAMVYILSSFLAAHQHRVTRYLLLLGDYSLAIYLLHNPWIVHVSHIVFTKLSLPDWLGNAVSVMLGLLIPALLYKYVIKKNPLMSRVMLGLSAKQ